jgi:hypothetical protein
VALETRSPPSTASDALRKEWQNDGSRMIRHTDFQRLSDQTPRDGDLFLHYSAPIILPSQYNARRFALSPARRSSCVAWGIVAILAAAVGAGLPGADAAVDRGLVEALLQGNSPVGVDPELCRAVRHFDQLGGQFLFSPEGKLTGIDLAVERMSVSDEDLRWLSVMPALETLKVAGGTITNRSVAAIVRHRSLRTLALNSVQIDAAGLAKLAQLPHLQSLRIRQASDLTDTDLASLQRFPALRYLELIEDNFSDRGMSAIARVKPLRLLDLRGNVEITAVGIRALAPLRSLVALRIGSPSIDDDTMAVVAGFVGLRRLTIDHAAVTDAGLVHIGKLPLEELRLTSCFQISDDGLQTVSKFDKLTTLSCRDMFFSATGLVAVGHLKRLRTLQLIDLIGLDDACLDGLIRGTGTPPAAAFSSQDQDRVNESKVPRPARLANLTRLELRGAEITTAGVELVATLGTLEHLNLANCQIDDRGVAHLAALKNLRTLDLSGNRNISDAAVDWLGRLTSLRQLGLDGTSVRSAAAKHLRARLPDCSVQAAE